MTTAMSISSNCSSSQEECYYTDHRRASLLVHPLGLKVLKRYKKQVVDGPTENEKGLANKIAEGLKNNVIYEQEEMAIATVLRASLNDLDHIFLVTGEGEEPTNQVQLITGKHNIVFCIAPAPVKGSEKNESKENSSDAKETKKEIITKTKI